MPYSRAKEKRAAKLLLWPDIRYSPTGEAKLFNAPSEVPPGWVSKHPGDSVARPAEHLDHDALVLELTKRGIAINPIWGNAHLKRIIDGDSPPTW
jgi:hypothetical protein